VSERGDRGRRLRAVLRSGPRRVVAVLLGVAGLLVMLSLGTRYLAYRADVAAQGSRRTTAWITIMKLFDVNSEANVPTWFSTALLLAAAATASLVGVMVRRAGGRDAGRWLALAGVLALLSLDEASVLHERLGGPADALLGDAAGRFAWVIPGAVLAAVVGAFFLGFVSRLPGRIRRHVLGAGTAFLMGAVLIEAISGAVLEAQGDRAAYLLVTAAEEGAEMAGAIWFLYAALSCLTLTAESAGSYRLALLDDLHRRGGHQAAQAAADIEVPEAMAQPRPSTHASF
jgi:hypothetical protein